MLTFIVLSYFILSKRERKRESDWGEGQRERERERILSKIHTISTEPSMGLGLKNCKILTEAEIKSDA